MPHDQWEVVKIWLERKWSTICLPTHLLACLPLYGVIEAHCIGIVVHCRVFTLIKALLTTNLQHEYQQA
jgi:hypothetical protein